MLRLKELLARLLPHAIGVRWLGQSPVQSHYTSFEEAQAEAERLNGRPFEKTGHFLHGHRGHDSKAPD
jgi:hypothetical protein